MKLEHEHQLLIPFLFSYHFDRYLNSLLLAMVTYDLIAAHYATHLLESEYIRSR